MNIARIVLLVAAGPSGVVFAACGGANAGAPSSTPSTSSASAVASASAAPDSDAAKRAAITRARAGEIAAAAVAWRRANGGCPTLKDLTDKYVFAPSTETDASGAPFTIECAETEVRVHTADGAVARAEAYDTRTPPRTSDPLPTASAASSDVPTSDQVMRGLASHFRRCYSAALRNDPTFSGSVHGTVVVTSDGSVKAVVIDPNATTAKSASLAQCITDVIKSARFAPSADGSEVRIAF